MKIKLSNVGRKPSEILQLMLDSKRYDPFALYSSPSYMCAALADTYEKGRITRIEYWLAKKEVEKAIHGHSYLTNYLILRLNLAPESARKPENKLHFYRGLIKRLKAKGK